MVLLVGLQMRRELGDTSTEASDLILWAARVGLMPGELWQSAEIDVF